MLDNPRTSILLYNPSCPCPSPFPPPPRVKRAENGEQALFALDPPFLSLAELPIDRDRFALCGF